MNTHPIAAEFHVLSSDSVEYTLSSLGRHMGQCHQAQGRWFGLLTKIEQLQALVSSRLVTTGALAVLCCWALLSVG